MYECMLRRKWVDNPVSSLMEAQTRTFTAKASDSERSKIMTGYVVLNYKRFTK